ncbi:MAG TPA: DMT family transporter [Geminicoccus sp.]|jgi:drug/metabolite transporter (DMT)-like permease|uniref:DMT family transporter n=1 Tax=Geminicoccus sp. TaxID=2024832 RepID=UPI002E37892B|nr:DMT family transporter [Geminicoccus sp.]HEX2528357.1 DMT family transporter [Geminicoccus sp.]
MKPGLVDGFVGVLVFSLTLPATRAAVAVLDPWFVAFGRLALAGMVAGLTLRLSRAAWPDALQRRAIVRVVAGVVLGFPLLTTLALRHVESAHAAVVIGLLPLLTAVAAVIVAGERPKPAFWLFAIGGGACVVAYTLAHTTFDAALPDVLLLAAALLAAYGYAEGAVLARTMPGLQVIAWALVLALPISLPASLFLLPGVPLDAPWQAWMGFLWVAIFSQYLGFYFWYRGLARGGIASVGQVQLLQTFLTLGFSALLLGEALDPWMLAAAAGTLLCILGARASR